MVRRKSTRPRGAACSLRPRRRRKRRASGPRASRAASYSRSVYTAKGVRRASRSTAWRRASTPGASLLRYRRSSAARAGGWGWRRPAGAPPPAAAADLAAAEAAGALAPAAFAAGSCGFLRRRARRRAAVGRSVGPGALRARLDRRSLLATAAAGRGAEAVVGAGAARVAGRPGAHAEEAGEHFVERGTVGLVLDKRCRQRFAHADAVGEAGRRDRAHRVERLGHRHRHLGRTQLADETQQFAARAAHGEHLAGPQRARLEPPWSSGFFGHFASSAGRSNREGRGDK